MCKRKVNFVKVVNFDHREKKQSFPFFRYNHLFENMNWFSIPNFRIKAVLWIYAIGEKGLLKNFVGSSRIQQNAISCYQDAIGKNRPVTPFRSVGIIAGSVLENQRRVKNENKNICMKKFYKMIIMVFWMMHMLL